MSTRNVFRARRFGQGRRAKSKSQSIHLVGGVSMHHRRRRPPPPLSLPKPDREETVKLSRALVEDFSTCAQKALSRRNTPRVLLRSSSYSVRDYIERLLYTTPLNSVFSWWYKKGLSPLLQRPLRVRVNTHTHHIFGVLSICVLRTHECTV